MADTTSGKPMKIVKDKVLVYRQEMVSGVGQQSAVKMWRYTLEKGQGKDKPIYWFWPEEHDEPGSMVHCGTIFAGQRSEGYGGRTLDFPTKDGVIQIQGPWHSNTDALYERTGVDLRGKHRTWGVISLRRGQEGAETVLLDVIHLDPDEGVVGQFDRVQTLAEQLANENDTVLFYFRQSFGGSSCGPVYPEKWDEQRRRDYFNKPKN